MKNQFKFFYLLIIAISFLISPVSIAERRLYSYDEIEEIGSIGGPEKIKIVADTRNSCAVQSHQGSLPYSPVVFSMIIPPYFENLQTGELIGWVTVIPHPGDIKNDIQIVISPHNTVKIQNKAVNISDNKVLSVTVEMCLIASQKTNGVLFYAI